MIYTFLSDEAFAITGTGSVMHYANLKSNGVGILDDAMLNYLDTSTPKDPINSHTIISDILVQAAEDASIAADTQNYRSRRLSCDGSNASGNSYPYGLMYLHFDGNKIVTGDTEDDFIQSINVLPADDQDTKHNKWRRRAYLFNIIETCFYYHKADGTYVDITALNTRLNTIGHSSDVNYPFYVDGSVETSSTIVNSTYRYRTTTNTTVSRTTENIGFYDSVTFKFKFGPADNQVVDIKVWLGVEKFKQEYPYSTIVNCIYPCRAAWLLNPADSGGEIQAVINAATYKDVALDDAVTQYDHTGIVVYKSRYTHTSVTTSNAKVGFVIMYKGAVPTSEQMRVFIREQLLNDINDEDGWRSVLPDLFVDAGFYIIPCFYQRVISPTNFVIEQNIASYHLMFDKMQELFANEDSDNLNDFMEILQAPGHDIYLLSYPVDPALENQEMVSLLNIHPTYQAVDSVGRGYHFDLTNDSVYQQDTVYYTYNTTEKAYIRMNTGTYVIGDPIPANSVYERVQINMGAWNTMTEITQAFAQQLANCVAVCIDENNPHITEFTEEERITSGSTKRKFFSFVSNGIEYHVLSLLGAQGIFDRR